MKLLINVFALLLCSLASLSGNAQVLSTTPLFPIDADSVTIIFDAAQGDAGLKNVAPPIYAHTGVITNLSNNGSDWKYTIAPWGVNLPKALMTPLGNNKYKLVMTPSIRSFYGVPAAEQILKMAFVFRNADGSKTGRDTGGGDIFADVYTSAMSVNIVLPANKLLFVKQHDTIPVSAISPTATTMKLFLDGVLEKTRPGNSITDTLIADNLGQSWHTRWIRIEGLNTTGSAADSFSYTVIPAAHVAPLPAGMIDGINYIDSTKALLCLYAPYKKNVFVIGDFNNWKIDSAYYLNITPDGNRYWLQINNLVPKQEYIFQYLVDGNLRIGDPFADKVSDPDDQYIAAETYPGLKPYPDGKTSGIATYLQTGQTPYPWSQSSFTAPNVTDLVIYELLIRDFTAKHDYPSLIDTLDYLKNLGINAIELMPVMEFEGNISWGYNPNYSFAPDKYYGTKNGLKQFVEAAHSKGIAVILDIVCNHHFGSSPLVRLYWDAAASRPAANSPWFNPIPRHPYNVGYDFNHESPFTRFYMERLIRYWLTEYHVDGYRFDMSKGFTQTNSYPDNVSLWGQYDASRISILENYTNVIHSVNPSGYAILEHFADNTEETVLAANNMLLWGNMNGKYNEATMGWNDNSNSDLSWISYKQRGWQQPGVVGYMESHDEERLSFKNIVYGNSTGPWYNIKDTSTSLKRIELAATFFYTIPGPKMIWQFGELGYDYSINYPSGTSGSRLDPKPIRWDYLTDWRRRYTKNIFSVLIGLKKSQPVFSTANYTTDLTTAIKRIWLRHSSMDATILGNFDVIARSVVPGFTRRGMWYELYTGDSLNVTDTTAVLAFKAGEYRLYTTVKLQKPYFTGISDGQLPGILEPGHVMAYPNPSPGRFTVVFNLPSAMVKLSLSVYDVHGKLAGTWALHHLSQGLNQFPVDLGATGGIFGGEGLYTIRIAGDNYLETGKVILK